MTDTHSESDSEVREIFKEYILDFPKYALTFLRIKTKDSRIIPLRFNPPQMKLWKIIKEEFLDVNKPVKVIILKARQEGISTFLEALIYWLLSTNFNYKAAVIGHIAEASTNLFNIYKTYYDNIPDEMKPELKSSNAKEVIFAKLGSHMKVLTANTGEDVGRSDTFQVLHVTEKAFYSDADSVMTALLQSLSDTGHYFDESTANGIGGRFYNDWQLANATDETWNGMRPVFFAWFDLPEYSRIFQDENEKQRLLLTLDQTEKELISKYQLTYEQLNWRRWAIKFKCFGNTQVFNQEYPDCPETAFITSGRPVFDAAICESNLKLYSKFKPVKFNLEYAYDENKKISGVKMITDDHGYFSLLEKFEINALEHYRFAVGTDVSEGLEQGDYCSMDVLDRKIMKYVIKFHGHIAPDLLAEEQHKLQIFLRSKVYFCTEVNNHGLTTVVNAYKLHVKQYYQSDFKKGFEVETNQLGFKTTTLTKPLIINNLAEAIREKTFVDEDKYFWNEALTFVRNAQGKMQAQGKDKDPSVKCFDDRVISKALSIECHLWMPNYFVEEPKLNLVRYPHGSNIKTSTDF